MPEVRFALRWPDGGAQQCVAPSRAIRSYLVEGEAYPVDELLRRATAGLEASSERVREVYGFACTGAAAQLDAIRRRAAGSPPGEVLVESLA